MRTTISLISIDNVIDYSPDLINKASAVIQLSLDIATAVRAVLSNLQTELDTLFTVYFGTVGTHRSI